MLRIEGNSWVTLERASPVVRIETKLPEGPKGPGGGFR